HPQCQGGGGGGGPTAGAQRIPEAVGLAIGIMEWDALLPEHLNQRAKHIGARREEHHRLPALQVLDGGLEDVVLRTLEPPRAMRFIAPSSGRGRYSFSCRLVRR